MSTTDIEKLVTQLTLDMRQYQREFRRAQGVTNAEARAIENRYRQMDRRLAQIGASAARSLIVPLSSVAAALSVQQVLAYADAWTSAKNSLAVAGVVGSNQADVLDRLYQSAQANAAPVGALADLFGKAQQASDNLGASQADLLKFSDGVATSLRVAGTSAGAASGALTQLGQLLGQARVQAEEFNSVNEGARPILMAVAAGLDSAGGSVSKLKALVNDGQVSGQQFFQAFLRGLPLIEKMAANSTQTIEQGVTKVNNAFTRYIGETDTSLNASQRLVAGLNALADNFDETADVVLKLASVIAGALVGRSIGMMVAKLGLAATVVARFVAALRAAATMGGLATAMGGLSAAAGPLGLVIGGTVVGALALFSSSSENASVGARTYAEALEEVRRRALDVAPAVAGAGQAISEEVKNSLQEGLKEATVDIDATKNAAVDMFSAILESAPRRLISAEQLESLGDLRDELNNGTKSADEVKQSLFALASSSPNFQNLANQMKPLLDAFSNAIAAADLLQGKLGAAAGSASPQQIAGYRQYGQSRQQGEEMLRLGKAYADEAARQNSLSKDQLAVEKEIATIKKDLSASGAFLNDNDVKALAQRNVAAEGARGKGGGSAKAVKQTAESRFEGDLQAVRDRTAALVEEQRIIGLSYRAQEERRMALDLEQSALADLREEARRKGQTDLENIRLSDLQVAKIREASAAYAEQADALRIVEEAQQSAQDSASEFYDTAKAGFVDVIKGTTSLGDALANLGSKLADLALNSAFDSIFGGSKATGGGGWLTGIFKSLGFAGGGYTGPGGKFQPAGVVHRGEYVFDQESVRAAGGPRALDAMRRGLKGYAGGGAVGVSAPTMPRLVPSAGGATISATYAPQIDARGADTAAVDRLERIIAQDRASFSGRVVQAVQNAQKRNAKV